jgi:hypothetical protein
MANEKTKKSDSKEVAEVKAKKPKGKPRGGNNWLKPENQFIGDPGDNRKVLELSLKILNLTDIDMKDVSQVQERLNWYFMMYAEADMKPTVSGMALSLNGMSRQTLWAIAHDKPLGGSGYETSLPPEVADLIKKAYKSMEFSWENNFQNGKLNPVAGIFLGKNNFGYQDKTEHVVTPNVNNDSNYDADSIRERYLIDSKKNNDSEEE